MSMPPDEPTRRLDPAAPPPGGQVPPPRDPHDPRVREREYATGPVDDPARDALLAERLDALRTALAVVGALALAALALAAYLLLTRDEGNGDARGASQERVQDIDERVDELEAELEDRATKDDVAEVAEQQEQLSGQIDEVAEAQPQEAPDSGEATDQQARDAIETLDGNFATLQESVDDLDGRVAALEEQAQQQP